VPRLSAATRDERRQRFIQGAWRCAARKGYRDTTIDDVCVETGLSKGAFYGYFESKQDLLLALLEEEAASIDRLMDELENAGLIGTDRLRRFARGMLERGENSSQVQVTADLWTAMTTEPAVRAAFVASHRHRRERLRSWIDGGIAAGELSDIPANALAALLLALADGLLLHGSLDPKGFRWSNIQRAVDILLASVGRR